MTDADKILLLQTIDTLDVGVSGKKVLKAILNIRDIEVVTQKLLCELVDTSPDSMQQVMQRLIDKKLVLQHGKYRGCTFSLNESVLNEYVEKYIQKLIVKNNLKR